MPILGTMLTSTGPLVIWNPSVSFTLRSHRILCNLFNAIPTSPMATKPFSTVDPSSLPTESTISLQEWQGWGTISPVPSMVKEIIHELKRLEKDTDARMTFDGNHGTLSGDFKLQEDKKHREKYSTLVLASIGRLYVFESYNMFSLASNAYLVVYASKVEHEEMMWNELKHAGKQKIWCLYPNKNAVAKSVEESIHCSMDQETQANENDTMHFVLIDGTWSNSSAMFRRLQDQAELALGEELHCISLNTGASSMHKLRPQPSWDRTCTAAAAVGLLDELHLLPELSSFGLDKQAEAVKNALEALLEALTARRLRMGRSISRRQRHNRDIC